MAGGGLLIDERSGATDDNANFPAGTILNEQTTTATVVDSAPDPTLPVSWGRHGAITEGRHRPITSTAEQNPDRQLEAIGACTKVFMDKISGKSRAKRTGLAGLMDYIREGDTVRVASMDRLGRSTRDLFDLVDEIVAKGAAVEFVNERITVDQRGSSPLHALMLGVMASFAEFERNLIRERQAEGIALAKAKGKYTQQPKLSPTDIEQAQAMVELSMPKTQIAATFGVSRQTLYTALRKAGPATDAAGTTG